MSKFFRPALFILLLVLIWSLFQKTEENQSTDDVVLLGETEFAISKIVSLTLQNNSNEIIRLANNCPKNPLNVEKYVNGEWIKKETALKDLKCATNEVSVNPKEATLINYSGWSPELFDEEGKYRISVPVELNGAEKTFTKEIEITSRSFLRVIWEEVFYKPIFNVLIYILSLLPSHNLGWAVILLTILIKIILLIPNQKALKSQKKMQKIQPQLDALKKKYEKDPQRLAAETMAIWKKHKVSPMGSCLPLLIQFPILIALFYVVKDGLTFINPNLLYEGLKDFNSLDIDPWFLGLDLTQINFIILPILVGGLQYIQMKLSMGAVLKNQVVSNDAAPNPMVMMNKTMIYFMPVMIAVFTATVPAAVGFYWGTSTLFGIGQQLVVNRSKD